MLIVSDASPIIALAVCDKLNLLDKLFDRVCIPQAVFDELAVPDKPKSRDIVEWAKDKVIQIKNNAVIAVLSMNLDIGEAEALALYWETTADFLLIDEKRGRIIAHRNGIKTIGTIGILLLSKQKGFITSIKFYLDLLIQNGFHLSEVFYRQILERAGE